MKIKIISIAILLIFLFSGCQQQEEASEIVLYSSKAEASEVKENDHSRNLRVALASVLSPQESLSKYKDLLAYMGAEMDTSIDIIQKQSYQEVNQMLKSGEVDIAFICSLSYVLGLKGDYIVDVAAPVVEGEALYQSYTIVSQSSPYERLEDLEGKRFAYTDPYSYTGRLSMLNQLYQEGYGLNEFFRDTYFTYSHDYSVKAVELGIVDGATVDGVLFEQLQRNNPELTNQIRVIGKGEKAGTPPVVASKKADTEKVENFKSLLLNLQNHETGRELLQEIGFEQYISINQRDYEIIQNALFLLGE